AIVTSLTLVQLLLQFALQLFLAKYFGAGGDMDAYVAALAPPVALATILSGSLGYVLVPIVVERRAAVGEHDASAVAAQIGFCVAWGVVIGAAVTVALLAPLFVIQLWQSGAWRLPLQPATRRCLTLLAPLVLAAIFWRLDPLLDRYLGSRLPTGNIAHIGYSW